MNLRPERIGISADTEPSPILRRRALVPNTSLGKLRNEKERACLRSQPGLPAIPDDKLIDRQKQVTQAVPRGPRGRISQGGNRK
jgi:hypothetical protein